MCRMLDAAVARAQQRALEQGGADAVALPGLLDAEGGLGFVPDAAAVPLRRSSAAPRSTPSTKKPCTTTPRPVAVAAWRAMNSSDTAPEKRLAAAVRVEPQQVVAIGVGLADPQFADGAAVGQGFASGPTVLDRLRLSQPGSRIPSR